MIRKALSGYLIFLIFSGLSGQTRFVSLFDFESCTMRDKNGFLADLSPGSNPECVCGTDNEALEMDLNSFELSNSIDSIFRSNFTICFDIFIENIIDDVDILSKSAKCSSDTSLNITYRVRDSLFSFFLREGSDEFYNFLVHADPRSCWQNVCLSVNGNDIRAYVNGVEKGSIVTTDLLRLDNGVPLSFNKSDCQNNKLNPLNGRLDRILFANYAFIREDIQKHYLPQHKILTQDTIIFIGDQFELRSVSNCPSLIGWSPNIALSDINILNPICNTSIDVHYATEFRLGRCVVRDSVLVRTVDKSKLECKDLRLPTAFSPNGDNINDEFFISNSYIVDKLSYFEILDRNGGILFSSSDVNMKWDGSYKNKILNPGTFFYRVEYTCKDQVFKNRGSVMLMR